jgi:hypothetical protein
LTELSAGDHGRSSPGSPSKVPPSDGDGIDDGNRQLLDHNDALDDVYGDGNMHPEDEEDEDEEDALFAAFDDTVDLLDSERAELERLAAEVDHHRRRKKPTTSGQR